MSTKPKTKPAGATKPMTSISHCNFVGVQYDAKAVEAIQTIALGLKSNADALGKLAQVLIASNVNLECLLKIDGFK